MRTLKLFLLIVALLASPLLMAQQMYVDVTNRTGFTILMLYVSPSNSSEWEEDVLGAAGTIANDETKRITLNGYSSPYFDLRAVDTDGDSYIRTNVDVSTSDVVFSLDDLRN